MALIPAPAIRTPARRGHVIKLSEADGGNLYLSANAVEVSSNSGVGIVTEEGDAGDLSVTLVGVATSGNDGGGFPFRAPNSGAAAGIR